MGWGALSCPKGTDHRAGRCPQLALFVGLVAVVCGWVWGLFGGGGFVSSPLCPLFFFPCGWSSAASVLPRAAIGAPIAGDYQKECPLSGSIGAGE